MTLRRFVLSLLATCALLGAFAEAGWAHKAASTSQLDAMVYHSSGRYIGGQRTAFSTKIPLKCFQGVISTVAGGSTYAALGFSTYAESESHASLCQTGNGVAVLHLIKGRWYVLFEGSEGYPPTKPTKVGSGKSAFTEQPVPRAVSKDLYAGF